MGSRSKSKKRGSTVVGRRWKYDRKKRRAERVTFTDALEAVLCGFRPDTKSEVAVETQLANAKAERPMIFASRYVKVRHVERVLAREPAERQPRPRLEKRREQRALMKRTRRASVSK